MTHDIRLFGLTIERDGAVRAIAAVSAATCGKGTLNGEVAHASRFGFAACVLHPDHRPPCDSGPLVRERAP